MRNVHHHRKPTGRQLSTDDPLIASYLLAALTQVDCRHSCRFIDERASFRAASILGHQIVRRESQWLAKSVVQIQHLSSKERLINRRIYVEIRTGGLEILEVIDAVCTKDTNGLGQIQFLRHVCEQAVEAADDDSGCPLRWFNSQHLELRRK